MAIVQSEVTGTHTGPNGSLTTLTDSAANFVVSGVQVNDIIYNITDGSSGTITAVAATVLTFSGGLAGGAQNDFDTNESYRVWATEPNYLRIELEDHLGSSLHAVIVVSNQNSSSSNRYVDYQKIRIRDNNTSNNPWIFAGKIEKIDQRWDEALGEIITLEARDNLQELLKRMNNNAYTGYIRRSAIVAQIISDYSLTFSGIRNIDTSDAVKFTTSVIAEPAGQLDVNFDGSGKNALRSIAELAQEDPWNATPTGIGYDYYLDIDFNASGAVIPDLHYFIRGSRPAGGAAANGLSIVNTGSEGNQTRRMLFDYSFPVDPAELITIVRIEYKDSNGADAALRVASIDISNVVGGPFTIGETITGGTSGVTATVQYYGTSFLLISAWSGFWTIGETITGGASLATARVDRALRQDIEQDVEVVLLAHDIDAATAAALSESRDRAAALLNRGGNTVQRGEMTIVGWPAYIIAGVTTTVRTGMLVRATNATAGIDSDMLVTDIIYEEGPGRRHARVSVLGTSRGRGASRHVLRRIAESVETAHWQSELAIGGIPSASQIVNITSVFTAVDFDDISWTAGTATYADGSTQAINVGSLNLPTAALRYIYLINGNATLQNSTSFANVLGMDRNLIAIAQRNVTSTEEALIISVNSGSPQLVAGTLIANELSAITANMGLLTAGAVKLPTGTGTSQTHAGLIAEAFTGFVLTGPQLAGYNAGVRQVYIQSADGRLYAGGGAVVLDVNGVTITTATTAGAVHFGAADYQRVSFYNENSGRLVLVPNGAGLAVTTLNLYLNTLEFSSSPINITSLATPANLNFLLAGVLGSTMVLSINGSAPDPGTVRPNLTGGNFGTAANYWGNIYTDMLYTQDVRRRSGIGGDIGTGAAYWNNIYVNQVNAEEFRPISGPGGDLGSATQWYARLFVGADYNYIGASTGDMDFYVANAAANASILAAFITDGANPALTLSAANAAYLDLNTRFIKGWVTQATVGAAGAASAPPASPQLYLQIESGGVLYVVPAYLRV